MNIPDEYKVKLTMEFMSQFFHELHDIFGTSLTPSGGLIITKIGLVGNGH